MADVQWLKPPACLLLVEGPTDKQVVRNLRKRFRGERSIPTIDGIPKHCRKFSEKKTTRAQVHAWLATRETPGFMGSVVGEDDLEVDGPVVTRFADWLRTLFG